MLAGMDRLICTMLAATEWRACSPDGPAVAVRPNRRVNADFQPGCIEPRPQGARMARDTQGSRDRGLSLFKQGEEPNLEAMAVIDAERNATRAKTARLRELRVASEAKAAVAEDNIRTEPKTKKRKVPPGARTKRA